VLLDGLDEAASLQAYGPARRGDVNERSAKSSSWPRSASGCAAPGPCRRVSLLLQPAGCASIRTAGRFHPPGGTVRLTNLEFRLLHLLMSNPGWTLSPQDILERVWAPPITTAPPP